MRQVSSTRCDAGPAAGVPLSHQPPAALGGITAPRLPYKVRLRSTRVDSSRTVTRRAFLATTLVAAASSRRLARAAQRGRTRLILLGTGGGPRPRKASSGSAQAIVCNDTAYVIDCGDGVARQLVFAGVPLPMLRHVFITHQHSDHNADYGNLIWLAWTAGLNTRVDTWGPPPLGEDDDAVPRDERVRHRYPDDERRPRASRAARARPRGRDAGARHVGRQREGDGRAGRSPAGRAVVRLSIRRARIDRS